LRGRDDDLLKRLERAIDEAAVPIVEAEAQQHVRVLERAEIGRCSSAWCTVIARPTCPSADTGSRESSGSRARRIAGARLRQLVDRLIDLVSTRKFRPSM
jgi:hypothetical protein